MCDLRRRAIWRSQSMRIPRIKKCKSYAVEKSAAEEEDMTAPVIIDVGNMKVECLVGDKTDSVTLGTQTEQVPAGLSAETSLELLKKLSITALRRELDRKKVKFSKNDGKDQLQEKLAAVLQLETHPPMCPLNKVIIHNEPAEMKKKAQTIAAMAHQTDTPQVLGQASKQLGHVTQEVRVVRQLLEAHVNHINAVSEHHKAGLECGCSNALENLCHSLSHYHVRKLESQLQETMSEIQMLQLEKHALLRAVSKLCKRPSTPSLRPTATFNARNMCSSPAPCSPCNHGGHGMTGDCKIDYLTSLMTSVLQHNHV